MTLLDELDPVPKPLFPKRFEVEDASWQEHLKSEGYAVIKNIASRAEVEEIKNSLW